MDRNGATLLGSGRPYRADLSFQELLLLLALAATTVPAMVDHRQVAVDEAGKVLVDERMVTLIRYVNRNGPVTAYSCQGAEHDTLLTGYILFRTPEAASEFLQDYQQLAEGSLELAALLESLETVTLADLVESTPHAQEASAHRQARLYQQGMYAEEFRLHKPYWTRDQQPVLVITFRFNPEVLTRLLAVTPPAPLIKAETLPYPRTKDLDVSPSFFSESMDKVVTDLFSDGVDQNNDEFFTWCLGILVQSSDLNWVAGQIGACVALVHEVAYSFQEEGEEDLAWTGSWVIDQWAQAICMLPSEKARALVLTLCPDLTCVDMGYGYGSAHELVAELAYRGFPLACANVSNQGTLPEGSDTFKNAILAWERAFERMGKDQASMVSSQAMGSGLRSFEVVDLVAKQWTLAGSPALTSAQALKGTILDPEYKRPWIGSRRRSRKIARGGLT